MPFRSQPLRNPDLLLLYPKVFEDERGALLESYQRTAFQSLGISLPILQINISCSRKGTVRGLHFQEAPFEQGKLIRVLQGRIYDVALDIRKESAWFGRWESVTLTAEEPRLFWIPPGFAHGFQALEKDTKVEYALTAEYAPDHEKGIKWDDPELAIPWDLSSSLVSSKDNELPFWRVVRKEI